MLNAFGILVIVLMLGVFVASAGATIWDARTVTGPARWCKLIGGVLLAIGAIGFFGMALSATGGLRWLPPTFEWPVGDAKGIVDLPDGRHVVPLQPSNRIQLYSSDWKFLRGWWINASAGTFVIRLRNTNQIEVLTARGQRRLLFDLDGKLIEGREYRDEEYAAASRAGYSAVVPTKLWLWPLTGPFLSWLCGLTGGVMIGLSQRLKQKPQATGE
jgi:hypothetical protein